MCNTIYHANNLNVLRSLPDSSVDLIYIDPPFNTGKVQFRNTGGKHLCYSDSFGSNFIEFLQLRCIEAHRILKPNGSMFVHADYREIHYIKVMLDLVFGRNNFINEIIWAYDFGGRSKSRWPAKHDNILFYAKDANNFTFNYDEIDRVPYKTKGGFVSKEKLRKGKTLTDVWWNTIVPTNSKEKTGYPTQKPLAIVSRIVKVHSNKGNVVIDFFAGSGTTGKAAIDLDRKFILIDENPQAIDIMVKRLYHPSLEILTTL